MRFRCDEKTKNVASEMDAMKSEFRKSVGTLMTTALA
jgi:hypothetical protein